MLKHPKSYIPGSLVGIVTNILRNLNGSSEQVDASMLLWFNNAVRPHTVVEHVLESGATEKRETPTPIHYRASSVLDNDSVQWLRACGLCHGEGRVTLQGAGEDRIIPCPDCGPGTTPNSTGWIVTDYTGLVIERDLSMAAS